MMKSDTELGLAPARSMHRVVCLLIGAWSALLTASLEGTAAESATGKNRVSPWPDLYEVIESPEADRLVRRGLELGQKWLGKPRYKPRKVQLRLSKPRDPTRKIKTGFSLTELSDPKAGVFTNYLSARTDQKSFHGLLAHEIFHVFQPQVKDVYMEGFVTYLAEKLCRAEGLLWEIWQKHFEADGDPVYGGAFKLMKELEKIVGEEALWSDILSTLLIIRIIRPRDLEVAHRESRSVCLVIARLDRL